MNILIACVNYNSYRETKDYLASIEKSTIEAENVNVDVCVADNSTIREEIDGREYHSINIQQEFLDNIGYLPAAAKVIKKFREVKDYDLVIISNVDIEVAPNFISSLQKIDIGNEIGWIAPQIWTEQEGRDKNPKVCERYSKSKLEKIRLLYKYPVLDYIYTNTLYLRKKTRPTFGEMDIYAGHGSFMILTKYFFNTYKEIQYPIFLFGEELFLAELNRKAGLKVRYFPALKVIDKEHTSTSKMKKKEYYKYNLDSINYILGSFYE